MYVFLEPFQPAANCMSWQQQHQQIRKIAEPLSPKVSSRMQILYKLILLSVLFNLVYFTVLILKCWQHLHLARTPTNIFFSFNVTYFDDLRVRNPLYSIINIFIHFIKQITYDLSQTKLSLDLIFIPCELCRQIT